jgi:hypothetical protein
MPYEQSEADKRYVAHMDACEWCCSRRYCQIRERLHEAAVNERVRILRAER